LIDAKVNAVSNAWPVSGEILNVPEVGGLLINMETSANYEYDKPRLVG
jgi:hypothetical protein